MTDPQTPEPAPAVKLTKRQRWLLTELTKAYRPTHVVASTFAKGAATLFPTAGNISYVTINPLLDAGLVVLGDLQPVAHGWELHFNRGRPIAITDAGRALISALAPLPIPAEEATDGR